MSIAEASPHKTGGYRAYKKIRGREFQFYSRDKKEADKKQKEFNQLSALAKKPPFSTCGRLLGFRIRICTKKGRKPYMAVIMQIGPYHQQRKRQWKYDGKFEKNWQQMKQLWIEEHNLLPCDIADYSKEIRQAKRLYIEDAGRLEEELLMNDI